MENITILPVNPLMIIPFALLLLSIAVVPLINKEWWDNNYTIPSLGLGIIPIIYYTFFLKNASRMAHTGFEYISFITLIGSLFVVAGGIHITIMGRSTPHANVILLAVGAIISNLLGTTGASMLLIRPYLKANKYRISGYHVVFFIFIVSNIGGALTPIGDPPLFLGYLKGVPFFWLIGKAWHIWAFTIGLVLAIFYFIDLHYYRKVKEKLREEVEAKGEEARASGLHNIIFLIIILLAVFINEPKFLREIIMIAAAAGSYFTTKKEVHERNDFHFAPINEVAILFAGIFATMVPCLDWLELNAGTLGIRTPGQFYWSTGILSGVLDNAPTYLNFLSASFGLHSLQLDNPVHMKIFIEEHWKYLQAISISAVFFGAITYIGNGPNFMVKSISEQAGAKCPSFFGYIIKYSLPILIPIFAVVWFLFFRG
ncbi:MAG: sodium:proton antiporter [Candidatus Schekmanbacteria bacterium RIFCSPHIGHO2_02_FULL_38_11]|uniref:Sodium:proton antiporter n=1 Tax=Candidatus Schekmanbacteria bacterium RIFCSPLOWO2_12_FULL_38_15 TaxID=1817883 RepID=A0A1F7SPZ6_9BACT|nr:MAG: sodium:proton antiporter [Candidatus Schekmanbacteria bacterium RIFCSPLOWO2_02_FULL_38_14]OGL51976.1 MAG: sodium:proton antiporter [Candidatus Schekmanbacteria bacterium RIFCSPHIGHO2_02_FULL_38_11]OGL55264.1 MAG: sodium:proton antiporter [Candidatus Schekmanbacteria bacterium RIFCSPLOWO2_12_FULL_38_15]